ncbi:IclR helix-turn-helix domain-containing protein [Bradyrhizobium shewense]|uniref:IclR helix-turn-helix domain-containing protein n=1 Tax=Bradyrhizobium shewense TaxID=1761772 RepID=A0A1C3XSK5_9BRAD|nr:helix-turn-helix domain-containing protein [Bradyrhizobium shewense]SCB55251.1 IclR helix-turn-helix domain-containing protein [Bradyrhizobium shewense]
MVAKMAGEIPSNSDAAVTKREKQSAIVGRLLVTCFVAMRSGYPRKHLGAVFEELLVAMMIRVSDELGAPPRTASDVSKYLGLPRSNVRRCLNVLISEGVVRKVNEHGHTGELDWLASRIDAEYFVKIRGAIIAAADELKALDAA